MERVDECEADEDRCETPIGHFRKGVHRLFEWTTIDHIEHWWYCDGGNMVPPGKTGILGLLLCLYWQAEYSGGGNDWKANIKRVESIFSAILAEPTL